MNGMRISLIKPITLAMLVVMAAVAPGVEAGDCPSSKRKSLPYCVDYGAMHLFVYASYEVENDCSYPVEIKVAFTGTYDDQFVLGPGETRKDEALQEIPGGAYCCTDNPDTYCSGNEYIQALREQENSTPTPTPTERDLRPRYYFEVGIGDALHAADFKPTWTARLACHSHDLNTWIDRKLERRPRLRDHPRCGRRPDVQYAHRAQPGRVPLKGSGAFSRYRFGDSSPTFAYVDQGGVLAGTPMRTPRRTPA